MERAPPRTAGRPGAAACFTGGYTGDLTGLVWNTRGLWHTRRKRRAPKFRHLRSILEGIDVMFLTDTHGSRGKIAASAATSHTFDSLPAGYKGFWSHMPAEVRDTGGVGLVVSEAFLARVVGDSGQITWKPRILPGRVACLSLSGPEGCLDLYVTYLQAGETATER